MHDTPSIVNLILKSIFVGFGFLIPLLSLIRFSNLKAVEVKALFTLTSIQAVRVSGIIYIFLFLLDTYLIYTDRANSKPWGAGAVENMLFGTYWILYWMPPFMYLLLSQLFWIKKLYSSKIILIAASLLLLILPSHILWLFIINSIKDSGLNAVTSSLVEPVDILVLLLNILVFTFVIITILLASGKLKKLKQ